MNTIIFIIISTIISLSQLICSFGDNDKFKDRLKVLFKKINIENIEFNKINGYYLFLSIEQLKIQHCIFLFICTYISFMTLIIGQIHFKLN